MNLKFLSSKIKSFWTATKRTFSKLFHKQLSRHVQEDHSDAQPRITKTNLDTYRQEVIKQGRKHLRPGDSTRHKVVFYSIAVGAFVLLATVFTTAHLIYNSVSKSSYIHNVTKIFPAPVAVVDKSRVFYDDVLFYYHTTKTVETSLEQQNSQQQTDHEVYVASLLKAIQNTYIFQQAEQQDITVSDEEINNVISNPEELAGGRDKFEASIMQVYGWSRNELESQIRLQLLTQKILPETAVEYTQLLGGEDVDPESTAEDLGLIGNGAQFVSIESLDSPPEQTPEPVIESLTNFEDDQTHAVVEGQDGVYVVSRATESSGEYLLIPNEQRTQLIQQQLEQLDFYSCQSDVAARAEEVEARSVLQCFFP